ncbi:MAG TPA: hypothetical protein VKZ82_02370, partial [Nonomuraea sp.]|nr:hypothetical protein [Nonomuraea sp.]
RPPNGGRRMNATRIGSHNPYLHASTTDTTDTTGDLDYIAIEHALNGRPVRLNLAEKVHAARLLHDRGYDLTTIGRHIGSDRRTIAAWRDNNWTPTAQPAA